jgi:hypothetical protein
VECVPRPGEACGDRFYAAYPEHAARQRRRDALARFRQARLSWLGEDHPLWLDEFCRSLGDA